MAVFGRNTRLVSAAIVMEEACIFRMISLCNAIGRAGMRRRSADGYRCGAGTFNPSTFLRVIGPSRGEWYVELLGVHGRAVWRKPQSASALFPVSGHLKPSPDDVQDLYLGSLRALGIHQEEHDIRFVEDDWESPTRRVGLGSG